MRRTVFIRGGGVAASCCVQLLSTNGLPVAASSPSQRRTNFILLSQGSQVLLANLFADPALFADIPTEAAGQLIEIMRNKLFVPRVHPDRIEAAN
jgi:hypothetical protein